MNTLAPLMRDVLSDSLPAAAGALHVNYRYMLSWARAATARRPSARILDFGCGDGRVVETGRGLGLDLQGADVFYGGENDRERAARSGLLGSFVHEIRGGRIPFADGSFDLVLSNQVLEHVEDLEAALREVSRILKQDGAFVCLFPTREVIREAHCGVPLLHWLPKGSPRRARWAALWHGIGSGFDKEKKTRAQWAREAVAWMDRYVTYRRRADLLRTFGRLFRFVPAEEHYLAYRFGWKSFAPLFRGASRLACRRLNGTVLAAEKPTA